MRTGMDVASQRFLSALERTERRFARAEQQLSSGRRISVPSDAPDDVSRVLVLRAALEHTVQARTNLGRVKSQVDTAEQALATAVQVLERVRVAGVQGATETQGVAQRRTLGVQVRGLLEQLVRTAATAVEGRYLFSGDTDGTAPYQVDLTRPNGVGTYQGSAATGEVAHPSGTRFGVSRTAEQIFDAPGASVFAAVNALRAALEGGPSEADPNFAALYDAQTDAVTSALDSLRTAQNHLNAEHAMYGAAQGRVAEALEAAHKLEIRQKAELSEAEDADVTAAALEMTQARTQRETAMAARAKLPHTSLFDYLR